MRRFIEYFINTAVSLAIGFSIGLSSINLADKGIILGIILLTAFVMARGTIHDLQEVEKK